MCGGGSGGSCLVWPQSPALIRRSRAGRERWQLRAKGKWLEFGVGSWGFEGEGARRRGAWEVSPGPRDSVAPDFHSPSALLYCSADFPESNTTSAATQPSLHCLWVTQCPPRQCQLPPHPSWRGAEEQTSELEANISVLKSHACFLPSRGAGGSDPVTHPVDVTTVLKGHFSVPRSLLYTTSKVTPGYSWCWIPLVLAVTAPSQHKSQQDTNPGSA